MTEPFVITLKQGQSVRIEFDNCDGSFEVHFCTEEHRNKIVVKETGGMPGNLKGGARELLYVEDFDMVDPEAKTMKGAAELHDSDDGDPES